MLRQAQHEVLRYRCKKKGLILSLSKDKEHLKAKKMPHPEPVEGRGAVDTHTN